MLSMIDTFNACLREMSRYLLNLLLFPY